MAQMDEFKFNGVIKGSEWAQGMNKYFAKAVKNINGPASKEKSYLAEVAKLTEIDLIDSGRVMELLPVKPGVAGDRQRTRFLEEAIVDIVRFRQKIRNLKCKLYGNIENCTLLEFAETRAKKRLKIKQLKTTGFVLEIVRTAKLYVGGVRKPIGAEKIGNFVIVNEIGKGGRIVDFSWFDWCAEDVERRGLDLDVNPLTGK